MTDQSVEALPGVAGMRWYEIRRTGGDVLRYQQGTYAPADGVHRWMGSIAQDKKGNMALGYSVVNGTDGLPGHPLHRSPGRRPAGPDDPRRGRGHQRHGVQTTTNSRWGDYTSMNVDPADDCTFWYVNEYYEINGVPIDPPPVPPAPAAAWQTRIASFKLPGC